MVFIIFLLFLGRILERGYNLEGGSGEGGAEGTQVDVEGIKSGGEGCIIEDVGDGNEDPVVGVVVRVGVIAGVNSKGEGVNGGRGVDSGGVHNGHIESITHSDRDELGGGDGRFGSPPVITGGGGHGDEGGCGASAGIGDLEGEIHVVGASFASGGSGVDHSARKSELGVEFFERNGVGKSGTGTVVVDGTGDEHVLRKGVRSHLVHHGKRTGGGGKSLGSVHLGGGGHEDVDGGELEESLSV